MLVEKEIWMNSNLKYKGVTTHAKSLTYKLLEGKLEYK